MDSVEHVRSYLSQFGAEDRVIEFTVSVPRWTWPPRPWAASLA